MYCQIFLQFLKTNGIEVVFLERHYERSLATHKL